jgi:tRNA dimethylallyltransferase
MTHPGAILIAGPTASGKSAFALALAERIGGTVINADAMQVYRELRILTARPGEDDERRAPHRLYGHVPAAEAYSAARYARDAGGAIAETQKAGRVPIVVGGTGLYFKALLEGLSPIPAVPDSIRAAWRKRAADEGAAALHAILEDRDPEMAVRLKPGDPQRIVRALEVLEATGISLARWQEAPGAPVLTAEPGQAFVVSPPRDVLVHRIDARCEAMLGQGAIDEVSALAALGLDETLPAMRALGVGPIRRLVEGRLARQQVSEAMKIETRQYAKRQLTWLRRNMSAWKWINTQETECLIATHSAFINSKA